MNPTSQPVERIVYVPEGDWHDPANYSGTPLYFGRALAAECDTLGLDLRVVETPETINTEPLWELIAASVTGRSADAADQVLWALPEVQRTDPATRRLLDDLRGADSWREARAPVHRYLEEHRDRTDGLISAAIGSSGMAICLNTLNPPWTRNRPACYYLDTVLATFYFDQISGLVSHRNDAPELVALFHGMEADALQHANHIFHFSSFSARLCAEHYPSTASRSVVVGAGANLDARPSIQRTVPPTLPLRLLFVGRDLSLKGGRLLLRAAALLDPKQFTLTIVTEARFHASEPLAGVRFHSLVSKAELCDLYAAHDMFLFPTERDAFGLVVCEAMAFGLPVLATPVRAVPDILGPATATFDPYVTSAEQLVDRLVALSKQPALILSAGRRNRMRARAGFEWPIVVASMLACILADGVAR